MPVISIVSCVADANSGKNAIARDLWLKTPHIFVMGDGTPTGEDETTLDATWASRAYPYGLQHDNPTPQQSLNEYRTDEILFSLPDDYKHATYKVRESYRWALNHNVAHLFQCSVDTYIHVPRLLASGFEKYDYSGWETGCGGRGFWVSARAMELLANAPVECWNWDGWTNQVLARKNIQIRADRRYEQYPVQPLPENDVITCHMNVSPNVYTIERAKEVHASLLRRNV